MEGSRHEVAFRRYLDAVAYHDVRAARTEEPIVSHHDAPAEGEQSLAVMGETGRLGPA